MEESCQLCLGHWQYDRSYTGKTPQPIASELKPPAAAKYYKHNDLSISFNFQNMSPKKITSKITSTLVIWLKKFPGKSKSATPFLQCLDQPVGIAFCVLAWRSFGTKVAELPMKIQTWATSMALKVVCSAIPWRFLRHSFSLLKHWICLAKCLLWMLFACHVLCLLILLWWPADMRLLESMWKNLSNAYPLFHHCSLFNLSELHKCCSSNVAPTGYKICLGAPVRTFDICTLQLERNYLQRESWVARMFERKKQRDKQQCQRCKERLP